MMRAETVHQGTARRASDRRRTLNLTAAGLSLIAVCYGLARFAYGLFVPEFREEFTLNAAASGGIASGSYASYCVAIVLATVLTPRLGGRVVAAAAGGIATVGTLAIALAPHTWVLAVGVVVAGASTGVASPPLAHVVSHAVAEHRRDRVQATINAGTGLGVAIAGPVALLTHEHWRAAWLIFSVLCASVTVWNLLTLPTGTAAERATHPPRLLPHPLVPSGGIRMMSAALLMGGSSAAVWTFGRDLLVSQGHMSGQASLVGWVLLGACGIFGAAAGDLAGRIGLAASWVTAMVTLAVSTVLIAAFPHSTVIAWATLSTFGAAYIALTGFLLIWATRIYTNQPAAGVGLAFLIIAIGQTAAAPAIGAMGDAAGAQSAFWAAALAAAAGTLFHPPSD